MWEYKTFTTGYIPNKFNVGQALDRIGSDGWELVSVVYNPVEEQYNYFFKRPKVQPVVDIV